MTKETDKTEGAPKSTVARISSVMSALSKVGISKDQENTFDKYKFRGIDDVYNALAPILSANGLIIIPKVQGIECVERTNKSGGALFYVTAKVNYIVTSEGGDNVECCIYGEAMDRGDKAVNKAMSAAYKLLCFQLFCIPVEGEDSETETHEVKAAPPKAPKPANPLKLLANKIGQQLRASNTIEVLEYVWKGFEDDLAKIKEASPNAAYPALEKIYKDMTVKLVESPIESEEIPY